MKVAYIQTESSMAIQTESSMSLKTESSMFLQTECSKDFCFVFENCEKLIHANILVKPTKLFLVRSSICKKKQTNNIRS